MTQPAQFRYLQAAALLVLAALILLLGNAPVSANTTPPLNHPDTACRNCHQQIYDAYQKTTMALGSGPAAEGLTHQELAAQGFTHTASGIRYLVSSKNNSVTLAYDRVQAPALHGTLDLQYFIGSGHRGRTWLYQQDGLWFETPINWYGKKAIWDMAPAFGESTTLPQPLPTDPNCLHCHAGQVQPSVAGVRNRFAAAPFRAPGAGCAACHGDPSVHLAGPHPGRGPILNPGKLSPTRRDAVCLQCHLEGDATVFRPGKSLATFVPGEDLSQSAVYFVDKTRAQQGGRASSQYEALLRSACKRATGDRLTCTTCHDPHSSPAPAERVAFFRARCVQCHSSPAIAVQHHPEQQDCATCHMPTRKTLDISHEQLTDHDIEAKPQPNQSLRARAQAPELVPVGPARITLREEGLAYAQLAQKGDRLSGQRALQLLEAAARGGADDPELHDQLGFLYQRNNQPAQAAAQYLATLHQDPLDTTAAANLAVLDASSGQPAEAMRLLESVVDRDPSKTAAALNLAFLQCRLGQRESALATLRRAQTLNPDSPAARQFLTQGTYGGQSCSLR